jgi:hypothetical protein
MKQLLLYLSLGIVIFGASCGKKSIDFNGTVTGLIGDASILQKLAWRPLEFGQTVSLGDSIRTDSGSQVEITFYEENSFRLDENTEVRIKPDVDSSGTAMVTLFNGNGTILSTIKKFPGGNSRYCVATPTSMTRIKGTVFSVTFASGQRTSHIDCFEGAVWVNNPGYGSASPFIVMPGFFSTVVFGCAPIAPAHIPPGQWKKMHHIMPYPMFTLYTTRFGVIGIEAILLLPPPVDFHGRYIKLKPGKGVFAPGNAFLARGGSQGKKAGPFYGPGGKGHGGGKSRRK